MTAVLAAVLTGAVVPSANAQSESWSGAFDQRYPEAAERLNGADAVHGAFFEALFSGVEPVSLEGTTYNEFATQMLQGAAASVTLSDAAPRFSAGASDLTAALDWAEHLRQELYDIYADPSLTDKYAAGEAAIDRYLARTDLALPPVARDMMLLEDAVYPNTFDNDFPRSKGLIWASHWLRLAVLDPLMYYTDEADKAAGVQRTLDRFEEMLATAPEGLPQARPTPAAVSPELVRIHPRAAKIFDNVGKIHDATADILVDSRIGDKEAVLGDVLTRFMDPDLMEATDYDWIVMSLRGGIFFQGGPAIGRMDRSERNMGHGHGEMSVMPGMPSGTTGGTGGGAAQPTPSQDGGGAAPGGAGHDDH